MAIYHSGICFIATDTEGFLCKWRSISLHVIQQPDNFQRRPQDVGGIVFKAEGVRSIAFQGGGCFRPGFSVSDSLVLILLARLLQYYDTFNTSIDTCRALTRLPHVFVLTLKHTASAKEPKWHRLSATESIH